MSLHRSSKPFAARVAIFIVVSVIVASAVTFGFFSSDNTEETFASPNTTAMSEGVSSASDNAGLPPDVVVAEDIKSISPANDSNDSSSTTTTTVVPPTTTPQATPTPQIAVMQLVLTDSDTDASLMTLTNGSVVRRDDFLNRTLTLRAFTTSATESVVFSLDGSQLKIEQVDPYRLNTRTSSWLQEAGDYTLTVEAYSLDDAQGVKSEPFTVQFTVE